MHRVVIYTSLPQEVIITDLDIYFILKTIVIAIVEGITEFLPISSTGHMIIIGRFIEFEGSFEKLFEIFIQSGAITAIVVLFRKKIFASFKSLHPGGDGFKLWTNILVALIPTGIVGLLLHEKVTRHLMQPLPVAFALLVGGVWMLFGEKKYRNDSKRLHIDEVSYKKAFIIGSFQIMAILWPGFSRSASTIIGGWIVGLTAITGAEFAFFLAIPTIYSASIYYLFTHIFILTTIEIIALALGFFISFMVAMVVVEQFINYIKHQSLKGFAYYRICIGALMILLTLLNII